MRPIVAVVSARRIRSFVGVVAVAAMASASYAGVASAQVDERSITVTPDSDLLDGDTVTLEGAGFTPNSTIYYCQGILIDPPSPDHCGTAIQTLTADELGGFTAPFVVQRFMDVSSQGFIDCAQPSATCGIGAADYFSPGGQIANAPIFFTPQDPVMAEITGTVVDQAGDPVEGVTVRGYRQSDGYVGPLLAVTDSSGAYVLDNAELDTSYRLLFIRPAGSGLVSEWYSTAGGTPSRSLATEVSVTPSDPVAVIDVELAAGGAFTGTVLGPSGLPVAGTTVRGYLPSHRFVGTLYAVTAADGTYVIDGVPADLQFKLLFLPPAGSGLANEWFDDVVTRVAATPIEVAAGGTMIADALLAAVP